MTHEDCPITDDALAASDDAIAHAAHFDDPVAEATAAVSLCFPATNKLSKSLQPTGESSQALINGMRALAYASERLVLAQRALADRCQYLEERVARIDGWIDPTGRWDSRPHNHYN